MTEEPEGFWRKDSLMRKRNRMHPIENIVLNDYLYTEIKKMIDEGTLKVGEKILKPELAKRFNVSLTPINGAINRLVGEGYIEQEARKGCSVKGLSKTEICQAFDRIVAVFRMRNMTDAGIT